MEQKLANAQRLVANITALAEEAEASKRKRVTAAEMLGKDETGERVVCGQQIFKERRKAILQRYSLLGNGLPPHQRNNLTFFKEEWDRKCVQAHGNAWPDLFLSKLKGVLDKAETDRWAFSNFIEYEWSDVLRGTKWLIALVPGTFAARAELLN